MGKRGTKKAPATVKIARGTFRRDRDGDPDKAPAIQELTACPEAPESLGDAGRSAWVEMLPQMIVANYITSLDLRAFERYCRAHDGVKRCDEQIEKDGGDCFTTEKGFVGQHPAVNQRFKWLDLIRRYEEAFWLNPTARSGKQLNKSNKPAVASRKRA